jgi:hypothetical protein
MKNLYTIFILLVSNTLFSQEFNLFELVAENKKSNTNLLNLAETIYLTSDLKISTYTISHFTNNKIQDTILSSGKKKKVTYRNFKVNCEFSLNSKLNSLYESNQMSSSGVYKNHLIINSETLSKIDDNDRFFIHEIDTDSELAIQREINSIKSSSNKTNVNVYVFIDKFNMSKPEFKFEKDTITSSGLVELKFTTSSKSKKIEWSSNVKFKNDDFNSPIINVTANDKVVAYYIDENGCKSNQDEITLIYKENCNCETSSGKVEFLYENSNNIIKANEKDEVNWEYKIVPDQSGSYFFPLPIKEICGDNFILEVKSPTGNIIHKYNYSRNDVEDNFENQTINKNKNIFVFNINLSECQSLITPPDSFFLITIYPLINGEQCNKRKAISSKIRFTKCH